jgi:hypothetical protein
MATTGAASTRKTRASPKKASAAAKKVPGAASARRKPSAKAQYARTPKTPSPSHMSADIMVMAETAAKQVNVVVRDMVAATMQAARHAVARARELGAKAWQLLSRLLSRQAHVDAVVLKRSNGKRRLARVPKPA